VQRRRWANGGLLILPKAVRYLLGAPGPHTRLLEGLLRCHYLGSIGGVSVGLLLLMVIPFDQSFSTAWLPVTAVPYLRSTAGTWSAAAIGRWTCCVSMP
jgi:hypothetical protein